jgi:hypothetical protein
MQRPSNNPLRCEVPGSKREVTNVSRHERRGSGLLFFDWTKATPRAERLPYLNVAVGAGGAGCNFELVLDVDDAIATAGDVE